MIYLTNPPGLPGFQPVQEVKPLLVDALKAIHPPSQDEDEGRFLTGGVNGLPRR